MRVEEKKKVRLGVHLIKADHGVVERGEPLTVLPQFIPIGFTETFVPPLDGKTKMKREFSTTVCNVCKPTRPISTQVNCEKLLFATNAPTPP